MNSDAEKLSAEIERDSRRYPTNLSLRWVNL